MSAFAIVLMIVVVVLVAVVGCCSAGYLERKDQECEQEQARQTQVRPEPTTSGEEEETEDVRAKIVERLLTQQRIVTPSTIVEGRSEDPSAEMNEDDQDDDDKCAICLGSFVENDNEGFVRGQCTHQYHRHCITSWLMKQSHCPECRQQMWDEEAYQAVKQEVVSSMENVTTSTNEVDLELAVRE